jgi:hypothetical protein
MYEINTFSDVAAATGFMGWIMIEEMKIDNNNPMYIIFADLVSLPLYPLNNKIHPTLTNGRLLWIHGKDSDNYCRHGKTTSIIMNILAYCHHYNRTGIK